MEERSQSAVWATMRLPFLVLTPACVVLGAAVAAGSGHDLNPLHLILALVGAVLAHVSVNALNEHSDFLSGLDLHTQPTPFSGGSGALPQDPGKAHIALITGIVSSAVTALIGVYFIRARGWGILPLGVFGLLLIAAYTRWITRNPLFCLIAPGLGFGTFMVMGTAFVLTGSYSLTALLASMVPFFLVSNLLLLNQFPDVEADRGVGRRHLPITAGVNASAGIYVAFLGCAYACIILGCLVGLLPPWGLLGLLSAFLAIPTARGVIRHAGSIPELIPYMGKNVVIVISTPVLLAIGLFLG